MKQRSYDERTHIYGQLWIWTAVVLLVFVPVLICIIYDAWPGFTPVLKGLLGVAPIYWTVGFIEVVTYTPMLGTGGTYLGFVTGNLTAIKVPSALNAMENADVKPGTVEGEVITTLAIGTSSIVTTLVIAFGVFFLSYLSPILNSPVLTPAFEQILPALFGGLAVVYISKNWKISITPLLFMIILFILVPSLATSVGILVPVGSVISIAAARVLYKKKLL